eukprot:gnl/Dysnectes_brevis/3716_a4760_565.p1 GENE.gnl/Dysnectes_brevis/3716_a4760_565~~gnl/Dysnectes_brevis/3716_a4760_565.p1  ORF type:complete len:1102 (+),score=242.04 gnl/Dysnectes_brevis/3716_a4760_565:238-3306(+)
MLPEPKEGFNTLLKSLLDSKLPQINDHLKYEATVLQSVLFHLIREDNTFDISSLCSQTTNNTVSLPPQLPHKLIAPKGKKQTDPESPTLEFKLPESIPFDVEGHPLLLTHKGGDDEPTLSTDSDGDGDGEGVGAGYAWMSVLHAALKARAFAHCSEDDEQEEQEEKQEQEPAPALSEGPEGDETDPHLPPPPQIMQASDILNGLFSPNTWDLTAAPLLSVADIQETQHRGATVLVYIPPGSSAAPLPAPLLGLRDGTEEGGGYMRLAWPDSLSALRYSDPLPHDVEAAWGVSTSAREVSYGRWKREQDAVRAMRAMRASMEAGTGGGEVAALMMSARQAAVAGSPKTSARASARGHNRRGQSGGASRPVTGCSTMEDPDIWDDPDLEPPRDIVVAWGRLKALGARLLLLWPKEGLSDPVVVDLTALRPTQVRGKEKQPIRPESVCLRLVSSGDSDESLTVWPHVFGGGLDIKTVVHQQQTVVSDGTCAGELDTNECRRTSVFLDIGVPISIPIPPRPAWVEVTLTATQELGGSAVLIRGVPSDGWAPSAEGQDIRVVTQQTLDVDGQHSDAPIKLYTVDTAAVPPARFSPLLGVNLTLKEPTRVKVLLPDHRMRRNGNDDDLSTSILMQAFEEGDHTSHMSTDDGLLLVPSQTTSDDVDQQQEEASSKTTLIVSGYHTDGIPPGELDLLLVGPGARSAEIEVLERSKLSSVAPLAAASSPSTYWSWELLGTAGSHVYVRFTGSQPSPAPMQITVLQGEDAERVDIIATLASEEAPEEQAESVDGSIPVSTKDADDHDHGSEPRTEDGADTADTDTPPHCWSRDLSLPSPLMRVTIGDEGRTLVVLEPVTHSLAGGYFGRDAGVHPVYMPPEGVGMDMCGFSELPTVLACQMELLEASNLAAQWGIQRTTAGATALAQSDAEAGSVLFPSSSSKPSKSGSAKYHELVCKHQAPFSKGPLTCLSPDADADKADGKVTSRKKQDKTRGEEQRNPLIGWTAAAQVLCEEPVLLPVTCGGKVIDLEL